MLDISEERSAGGNNILLQGIKRIAILSAAAAVEIATRQLADHNKIISTGCCFRFRPNGHNRIKMLTMSPKSYKKLQVTSLTTDFRKATEVVEFPLRQPASSEILIKNHYAAVNGTDTNSAAGRYTGMYLATGIMPFDIGFEGHGLVEAVGADVKTFKKGDAVLFLGPAGGYSEYIYADVSKDFPAILPASAVKKEYMCALNSGLTAAIGLSERAKIRSGDKVLITAAAGGTGHIAVQWAKMKGCHVIGITSTDEKAAFLKRIGADHVINYKNEDLESVLKREYPDGVDVVWETIGGEMFEMLFHRLGIHGRLVTLGGISGYLGQGWPDVRIEHLPRKLLNSSLSVIGFKIFDNVRFMKTYSQQLMEAIDDGRIKVELDQGEGCEGGPFVGMEGCIRAVEHMISGKSQGRVIIKIQ
jgi:hypothetical protein